MRLHSGIIEVIDPFTLRGWVIVKRFEGHHGAVAWLGLDLMSLWTASRGSSAADSELVPLTHISTDFESPAVERRRGLQGPILGRLPSRRLDRQDGGRHP